MLKRFVEKHDAAWKESQRKYGVHDRRQREGERRVKKKSKLLESEEQKVKKSFVLHPLTLEALFRVLSVII